MVVAPNPEFKLSFYSLFQIKCFLTLVFRDIKHVDESFLKIFRFKASDWSVIANPCLSLVKTHSLLLFNVKFTKRHKLDESVVAEKS